MADRMDEGMAFEAFRRRLEEEVVVDINRFSIYDLQHLTKLLMVSITMHHSASKNMPAGDTSVPHRRQRLRTRVRNAVVTVIRTIRAVITLCHNLGYC
jgi:hypothetical protein